MRIPFKELQEEFKRVLLKLSFTNEMADTCSIIFAANSRDGVYSHGLNRFPVFVEYIKKGLVLPGAIPEVLESTCSIERWDGKLAPGMSNASHCMDRAVELAKNNGIGCVAIRNTNHWMRGGTYGWQAADAGCIGICFTNATANMPGRSTQKISEGQYETGVSQCFICLYQPDMHANLIEEILAYTKNSTPAEPGRTVTYPGERTLKTRLENEKYGVPVNEEIWQQLKNM